jgi:DNA-binding transcriptional ArsR family regulator
VRSVTLATGLSEPTVGKALATLAQLGIVREATGRRRNRVFVYTRYLDLLNQGTETQPATSPS